MNWNLVDNLSVDGERRIFYPPLASLPADFTSQREVNKELYTIDIKHYTNTQQDPTITTDVSMDIKIKQPAAGFIDDNFLPDPTIRLHALGKSIVTFKPADTTMGDRLILKLLTFSLYGLLSQLWLKEMPAWWGRWVGAGCIPEFIIYENVDTGLLYQLLDGINTTLPPVGLTFPGGFLTINKSDFISNFLAGNDGYFINAEAGAYLGTAGIHPNPPLPITIAPHLIKFHVRYSNHTDSDPHPMNPLELFNLIFGDDSPETENHPLLNRINELGKNQTTIKLKSKRMLLRPPLRTWRRVEWEAEQEIDDGDASNKGEAWAAPSAKPPGSLGSKHLYNNFQGIKHTDGKKRSFNNGLYLTSNKCNLFVQDICLRSGFRICIWAAGATTYHYLTVKTYAKRVEALNSTSSENKLPLQGTDNDSKNHWGYKIENWMRSISDDQLQQPLNDAMTLEGRCFVLACSRPNRMNGSPRSGHFLIVRKVIDENIVLSDMPGKGLLKIKIKTLEASGRGAESLDRPLQLGGTASNAADDSGYNKLHLIELAPGKDPDLLQGLYDLNIINSSNP